MSRVSVARLLECPDGEELKLEAGLGGDLQLLLARGGDNAARAASAQIPASLPPPVDPPMIAPRPAPPKCSWRLLAMTRCARERFKTFFNKH